MMTKSSYSGYRFPPEIIQQAIWLYVRFTLSFRDVEDWWLSGGSCLLLLLRHKFLTARAFGDRRGAAWAS
jgi:hypothetical protein